MIGSYLGQYIKQERCLLQAWNELQRGNAALQAAEAMYRLNRAVKAREIPGSGTYQLKNQLVKLFYQAGFCVRVVPSIQTLECWHTESYRSGRSSHCPKCDNTGVWARHELYHFTFVVSGKPFNWHQPASLVDWPVQLSGQPVTYEAKEQAAGYPAGRTAIEDQAVVYLFLRLAGVPANKLPELKKFRDAIGFEWLDVKQAILDWYYPKVRRIYKWAQWRDGRFADLIRRVTRDPIPF